jgi:hypothetical protein
LATRTAEEALVWPATVTETGLTPEARVIESAHADGAANTRRPAIEATAVRTGRRTGHPGPNCCITPFYQTGTPLDSHGPMERLSDGPTAATM